MTSRTKQKKITLILLWLILILASFLRLYRIADYATFLGDEGRDALVVKRMIVDHKFTLLGPSTSIGNLYLGPVYYYFMLLPLWLARLDPVGPAIMVAVFGVATVYLIFKLGNEFFGSPTGLIAASLYSVSWPIISHSRFSWNPNPTPFFAALAVYALLKLLKSDRGFWIIVVGFCLGVCTQLHYISWLFVISSLVTILFLRPRISGKWYILGAGAFLIPILPLLFFEVRHHFIITEGLWRFFREEKKLGFSLVTYLKTVAFVPWRLFYYFLAGGKKIIAYFLIVAGFLPFLGLLKKEKKSPVLTTLFFWLLIGVIGVSFYLGDIHDHYLGFLFPMPFLLVSIVIKKIFQMRLIFIGFILLAFLLVVNILNLDPVAGRGPNYQIKRAREVGKVIAEDAKGSRFNLALISPTYDFRAMNYRYFVEIYDARPEGFENYSGIDTLYVIYEQENIPLGDMTAWEISSFGESEVATEWYFEDFGFRVVKLRKKGV